MKYIYLSEDLRTWLRKVVRSTNCFIDILDELKKENIEIESFSFYKPRKVEKYNILPFGKELGWLIIDENKRDKILKEIITFFEETLLKQNFAAEGMLNILFFISRLSLTNTENYELMEILLKQCDDITYSNLLTKLIDCLNNQNWYPGRKFHSNPRSVEEWEYLFQETMYLHSFQDPMRILSDVISYKKDKVDFLNIIFSLKPLLKAKLLNLYGVIFDGNIKPDKLLDMVKSNKIEPEFLIAIIFNLKDDSEIPSKWISRGLIEWIIKNKWNYAGKILMNRVFGVYTRKINENLQKKLQYYIKNKLKELFKESKISSSLKSKIQSINSFTDFEGFVGFFDFCEKNNEAFSFSVEIMEDFSKSWIKIFREILGIIPKSVFNTNIVYRYWTRNILEPKPQLVLSYILWFLLCSEEEIWKKWMRTLKKIVCSIKVLYYGSYNSGYIAMRFTEQLLLFILSLRNITEEKFIVDKSKRIQNMMDLLKTTILYPYIRLAERDEIIWNPEAYEPRPYGYGELFLINEYIKVIQQEEKKAILSNDFLESWKEFSTTIWPWMRE